MAEGKVIDRLDDAVEAMLRRPDSASAPEDRELAALWRVAADLVELPAAGFRARLGADLRRRASMSTRFFATKKEDVPYPEMEGRYEELTTKPAEYRREGFRSITPYLVVQGADRLIDFMTRAFGAEERLRVARPDGTIQHAEVRIGDSIVELGDGDPAPAAIHLYVQDADAAYAAAMAAGATSLLAPTDMPYGDREADVKDPFGNNWYVGTRIEGGPVPAGLHTVTPTLHAHGTDRLIDFIRLAFGAEEVDRTLAPDGVVVHAQLKLGDSIVELGEARGFVSPMPATIHYYVPDANAVYARALAAGATSLRAPENTPYGDRVAAVTDPFGNRWYIATHLGEGPV